MKLSRFSVSICRWAAMALGLLAMLALPASAQLDLDGGGLTLVQEGPAAANAGDPVPNNLATGATPFASSDLGEEYVLPYHLFENLNDGAYGNGYSWIGGDPEFNPYDDAFAGIDLGNTPVDNVQSIAFGRSNVLVGDVCNFGTVCTDRHLGLYTLQYTQVPGPSNNLDLGMTGNALTGWVDIGTLDYIASEGPETNFNNTWQRHRYNFDPVSATGIRLIVPMTGMNGGTAIDEIELYDEAGAYVPPPPPPDVVAIAPVDPYTITWDGNDGDYFDEEIPPDNAIVPDNFALASNGAMPFTSSDLGPELGIVYHVVDNVNDGFYGNSNSWIGGDNNPYAPQVFAGVALAEPVSITRIAWGRDNGNGAWDDSYAGTDACGGQCDDRSLGTYTLQFTRVVDPDADTADTGDADTGWQTIGTVGYTQSTNDGPGGDFTSFLRHQFEVSDSGAGILATGVRLLVPRTGLGGGTAIDELEIYGTVGPVGPACDFTGDGICGIEDINALTAVVIAGSDELKYDLDRNGEVNQEDRRIWVEDLKNTWYGDSNLDLEFTSGDMVQVFVRGKYETDADAGWDDGDWNGDGKFGSSDMVTAFAKGGYEKGQRPPKSLSFPSRQVSYCCHSDSPWASDCDDIDPGSEDKWINDVCLRFGKMGKPKVSPADQNGGRGNSLGLCRDGGVRSETDLGGNCHRPTCARVVTQR